MGVNCSLPGFKIEPLAENHLREAFSCGLQAIDKFIGKQAYKDNQSYKVRVQVATIDNCDHIVGFYSLALATLKPKEIGGRIGNKFGKWNIPAVYLAMIGTDHRYEKKGIGSDLMLHAFQSTMQIADLAGTACLTLDAVDEAKAAWYADRDFKFIHEGQLGMYIPVPVIRAACEAAENAMAAAEPVLAPLEAGA